MLTKEDTWPNFAAQELILLLPGVVMATHIKFSYSVTLPPHSISGWLIHSHLLGMMFMQCFMKNISDRNRTVTHTYPPLLKIN